MRRIGMLVVVVTLALVAGCGGGGRDAVARTDTATAGATACALSESTTTCDCGCSYGCTLTLGYWKNHTDSWPAGFSPDAPFFDSGKSWLAVLQAPPRGDVYYIFAHQWIAARLNVASGASIPSPLYWLVLEPEAGETYFQLNNPGQPVKGDCSRECLLSWVEQLDDYNNGAIGPGHCGG